MYSIQFTSASYGIFKKLPIDVQNEIKRQAGALKENPLAGVPLKGLFRRYRSLHFTYKGVAYRVIYQVFPKISSVIIFLADKRENIYKRLVEIKI